MNKNNNKYTINKLDKLKKTLDIVNEDLKHSEEEQKELSKFTEQLINKLHAIFKENNLIPPIIDIVQVGSTARNTNLNNDYDIDIFVRFEKHTNKELLEEITIKYGEKVINKLGGKCWVEYAEHPYLSAKVDKYEIDIVPCYKLNWGDKIISAVDRTPLHNEYVINKIQNNHKLVMDIKILKKFLKGIGVYGSDLKTKGFSGYLCELLIIYYGGFLNLLNATQNWKIGEKIILEDLFKLHNLNNDYQFMDFPKQPLIVYDPTDINRNVAAALSNENFCKFIYYSYLFLNSPNIKYFNNNFSVKEKEKLNNREKGKIITLILEREKDTVEDIIYPQMERLQNSINKLIKEHDFEYLEYSNYADENYCYLSWEFLVYALPNVKIKIGPYIYQNKNRINNFINKYDKCFVKDCTICAYINRQYTTIDDLFKDLSNGKLSNKIVHTKQVKIKNCKIITNNNNQ